MKLSELEAMCAKLREENGDVDVTVRDECGNFIDINVDDIYIHDDLVFIDG